MNNVQEFLLEYSKHLEWSETNPNAIARRLCEEYFYNREFLLIFYGWLWGKSGDEIKANCESGLLKNFMEEHYNRVAKENNWDMA